MKLYIMRHGQAESSGYKDEERPLSEEGHREIAEVARQMKNIRLDGIIASPYLRAQQTATLMAEKLSVAGIRTCEIITPNDPANSVLEILPDDGHWLVVAHMPLVSWLTGLLTDEASERGPGFGTAMVVELDLVVPVPGLATQLRCFEP